MELLELLSWLSAILIPSFDLFVTALSLFFYVRTRKRGFAMLGASFLVSFVGYFLGLPLRAFLLGQDSSLAAFGVFAAYEFGVLVAFGVLVVIGLVLLYSEVKPNPTTPSS